MNLQLILHFLTLSNWKSHHIYIEITVYKTEKRHYIVVEHKLCNGDNVYFYTKFYFSLGLATNSV